MRFTLKSDTGVTHIWEDAKYRARSTAPIPVRMNKKELAVFLDMRAKGQCARQVKNDIFTIC